MKRALALAKMLGYDESAVGRMRIHGAAVDTEDDTTDMTDDERESLIEELTAATQFDREMMADWDTERLKKLQSTVEMHTNAEDFESDVFASKAERDAARAAVDDLDSDNEKVIYISARDSGWTPEGCEHAGELGCECDDEVLGLRTNARDGVDLGDPSAYGTDMFTDGGEGVEPTGTRSSYEARRATQSDPDAERTVNYSGIPARFQRATGDDEDDVERYPAGTREAFFRRQNGLADLPDDDLPPVGGRSAWLSRKQNAEPEVEELRERFLQSRYGLEDP